MQVAVMLEQTKDNGYRATTLAPLSLVAEAPTRGEVMDKIRGLIAARLAHVELLQVEVPVAKPNPWLAIAGTWRDHPDVDEVMAHISEYRRNLDADADRL